MPAVRAVLFDKDGTLIDFQATWGPAAVRVVGQLSGGDPARRACLARAINLELEAERIAMPSIFIGGATEDYAPHWAACLGATDISALAAHIDALFRTATADTLRAVEGIEDALASLERAGMPFGMHTNDAEANARDQIARLGLTGRFRFVAGYDSGFGAKPEPGALFAFAHGAGVPPEAVAMVGDSGHDMETARRAGARACLIAPHGRNGEEGPPVDHVAPHLRAAVRWVLGEARLDETSDA